MENEFSLLENKIEQLVGLLARLRTRNCELNGQLDAVQAENLQLRNALETAKDRVSRLIDSIPEDDSDSAEEGEA